MKWRKKVLLAKSEVSYGTDSTPAVATDAILARNMSLRPLVLQYERREYDVPYYGNKGQVVAGQYSELSFEVEMAGAGAAGTAPKYGPLLKACGMGETLTPAVSAVYAPVSGGEVSASIYFRMDGREHKLLGCLGNVEARIVAGRLPVYAFTFIGLHVQPTDTAIGAPTLTGFQSPLAVNKVNTTPFTLHTFAGKFRELMISTGNVLPYRNLPNSERIEFVDRVSRGSVRLEDELVATKDWWAIAKAATLGALTVTQGTIAGNKVTIAAPNVQLTDVGDLTEEEGIGMLGMGLELRPSAAGNDEFSITVA